ncbi:MAG: Gfo/Idh/MocA family protein [Steroidobacteraceae bacterium]
MKIGIVGCGTISRHHLAAAARYPGATVVGVADADLACARAQAARFGVAHAFASLTDLMNLAPEVVHVLTPPDTHARLACEALAGGAHVYVEKPMALTEAECLNMETAAQRAGRQLCVGHSMLYMPAVLRARQLLASGAVGELVHAAAGFNYDVRRNTSFREGHWAKKLPGGLAEDLAVHPASILIGLLGTPQRILALSRSAPEIPDGKDAEVLATLDCARGLGALSVSLRARPDMALLDLSCSRAMLRLNIASMSLAIYREHRVPKAVDRALVNIDVAAQLTAGTLSAACKTLRGKIDGSWGVVPLIHAFYAALAAGRPVPFGPSQGLQVVKVIRTLWPQCRTRAEQEAA